MNSNQTAPQIGADKSRQQSLNSEHYEILSVSFSWCFPTACEIPVSCIYKCAQYIHRFGLRSYFKVYREMFTPMTLCVFFQWGPVCRCFELVEWWDLFNSSLPGQNGRNLADDVSKCIFMNEKFCILIRISLKFDPKGPIDNNPALVYTWLRRIGNKPLSEAMLTRFTDVYVLGGDGLNSIKSIAYYRKISNISRISVGNIIVHRSDVVGAQPVCAVPTISSFSTEHLTSKDCTKTTARQDEKHLSFGIWYGLYYRFDGK